MSQRLKNRKILITGAAGEIGKVLARRLLLDGCEKVILVGRGLEKLETAKAEILRQMPEFHNELDVWPMDCSSSASLAIESMRLLEKYGTLDGLVNNAGSAGAQYAIGEFPERFEPGQENIQESAQGVLGTAWLSSLYLKKILKKGAAIVNVSSIFSKTAYYARSPYVVPKAAMNQWSQCLARELGKSEREIRVNTVLPGPVETERIQRVFTTMDQRQRLPAGSTAALIKSQMLHAKENSNWLLKKDEIADSIAFVLSEEGGGFHGQELEVARGLRTDTQDELELIGRPDMSCIDLSSVYFWINTGENVESDLEMLQCLQLLGASGLVTSRYGQALTELKERLSQTPSQKGVSWFFQFNELDHLAPADSETIKNHISSSQCKKLVVIRSADTITRKFGKSLLDCEAEKINQFIAQHISQPLLEADQIDKIVRALDQQLTDDTLFISLAEPDLSGDPNPYNEIAVEARRDLFRIWHHEAQSQKEGGRRKNAVRLYQLVSRQQQTQIGSMHSVAEWAALFASGAYRQVDKRQIYLLNEISTTVPMTGFDGLRSRDIKGLHSQRVAVITGGSEGIGGEISRQLILSGAKIVIAERSSEKLNMIRAGMVAQCREMGYNDPEERILLLPNTDVLNPEAVDQVIPQCLARFGRVDYVVNNVGLAGAERMVVDMSLEKWNQTQLGNVICNYHLIQRALPTMLNQGFGSLTLMSSYFGGYRHGIVPYTNRADYAVSKSAQMYLAEMLAPFIGPKVQINALAPGPVDGARLNGRQGFPGLYLRRSRLVIENKLLNSMHQMALDFTRQERPLGALIESLQINRLSALRSVASSSPVLAGLLQFFENRQKRGFVVQDPRVFNRTLAALFYQRLWAGGLWPAGLSEADFLAHFDDDDQDFVANTELELGASEFLKRMKNQFSLQKMPTDRDLAFDVIWSLATRTYSGEVLYPSGGFRVDGERVWKSFCGTTAQALVPRAGGNADSSVQGRTVFVLAGSHFQTCWELVKEFVAQKPARVVVIGFQNETGNRLHEVSRREKLESVEFMIHPNHRYDEAIYQAAEKYGAPEFVFSYPLEVDSQKLREGVDFTVLPTLEQFKVIYHSSLTQHFLATKASAHYPSCQTFLLGGHGLGDSAIGRALHEFLLMSLRHLTLCAGKEASYTGLNTGIYQVDLADGLNGLRPYWQLAAERISVERSADREGKKAA